MRRIGLMCVAAVVSGVAMAQAPAAAPAPASGPAAEVQRGYAGLKGNILKAAENMPAENYGVKPTPEIRTFARVVNHITEAQFRSCGVANGLTEIAKPPADTADKTVIVDALKASFAECDKAYGSLTDANLTEMFTLGQNKRSRVGLMWGNVSHDNEQYATLALYMRLKGLVPPSSEK
jgi:hypothetical protein